MKNGIAIGVVAVAVVFTSGCNITQKLNDGLSMITNAFSSPKIPVSYLKPANISGAEEMQRIAVIDSNGNGNAVSFLESSLSGIRVNSAPYFTLVDRSIIDKIIKEQKFSDGMLADGSTRVKFGKLTGADTVVSGNLKAKLDSSSYSETRSKCSGSKIFCSDKDSYSTRVSCSKHTAIAVFEPKAVSVETGRILFSKNYTKTVEESVCSDDEKAMPSDEMLKGQAIALVAKAFKTDIAPYLYTVDVELMEDDDSAIDKNAKQQFDIGVELAENARFDNACSMFAKAQSQYADSVALTYNNGVCAEYSGDIEKAQAFYQQAETLTQDVSELKFIIDGEDRLKARNSDTKMLNQLSGQGRI